MFISSVIIIILLFATVNCILAIRRIKNLVTYACQQTCEHYLLKFYKESLKLKRGNISKSGVTLNFEFKYGDDNIQYNGIAITDGFNVKEIVFQSPKQNTNDDIFTPANELKSNVIKFPNEKKP